MPRSHSSPNVTRIGRRVGDCGRSRFHLLGLCLLAVASCSQPEPYDRVIIDTYQPTGGPTTVDTKLSLFDSSGNVTATDNDGNPTQTDYARIDSFGQLLPGTWYIRVEGETGTDTGPYAIRVLLAPDDSGLRALTRGGRPMPASQLERAGGSLAMRVRELTLQGFKSFAGKQRFGPEYLEHVQGMRSSLSAVQAKILLDRPVVKEGILVGMRDARDTAGSPLSVEDVHQLWEDTLAGRVPKIFPYHCPVPTNFDHQLATAGKQLLTLGAAAPRCG